MSTPGAPSVSRVFAAAATPSSSTASLPPQLPRPSLAPLPTLYPPENFTLVSGHIYRSGFPRRKHHPFLQQIGLRSILTLVLEDYPDGNLAWMEKASVRLYQFGVAGNKEPFVDIPEDVIADALAVLLDRRNHPILIHCNKGKHRTGCLVGCLRRLQHWSLAATFDEYRRFSAPKSRSMDLQFIELFDPSLVWDRVDPRWLPHWSTLEPPLPLLRTLRILPIEPPEEATQVMDVGASPVGSSTASPSRESITRDSATKE